MTHYTIRPINTGFIQVDHGVHVISGQDPGKKVFIPSIAWLVQGGGRTILVDTGMCESDRADKWHHKGSYQPKGHAIHEQLASLGVDLGQVDTVVFTHLHWDHCSNMKHFDRANFVVHRAELEFARNPHPWYYRSYEAAALGLEAPFADVEFSQVDGEEEIADGIRAFPTPGHSPGHQSVAVRTSEGLYVITGDAVFVQENLKGDSGMLLPYLPIGRYVNFFDMWASLERIARMGGYVLPGHDLRVLERRVYP